LIQVSKMKTDLDFPWFFEKVEDEAKAIDTILKRIASDFETNATGLDLLKKQT
jgi:hypothetical protein